MQAPLDASTLNAAHKNKIVSAADAVQLIHDGDTVATGGFVGIGFAESIAVALAQRWESTQTPQGLTLVYAAGQGDGKQRGKKSPVRFAIQFSRNAERNRRGCGKTDGTLDFDRTNGQRKLSIQKITGGYQDDTGN